MLVVVLSLGAALCLAAGAVLQQRAAAQAPPRHAGPLRLMAYLVRQPLWIAGVLVTLAQYALQLTALGIGRLVLVEPLLVTSLLFALPIAARLLHRRLSARDWTAAVVTAGALAAFVVASSPYGGGNNARGGPSAVTAAVVAAAIGVAVLGGLGRRPQVRATLLGAAAGIAFGTADAMSKATIGALDSRHLAFLLGWQIWLTAVAGIGGFVLLQSAYHAAELQASLPAVNVLEPVCGSLLGVLLFGEHLRGGGIVPYVEVASAVAMVWGVISLSRSPLVAAALAPEAPIDEPAPRQPDSPASTT